MELVRGVRNKKVFRSLRQTNRLKEWRILPLTESIDHRATMCVESHALTDGMRLAAAPTAASAAQSGVTLVTANLRHDKCTSDILPETFRPRTT